MPAERVVHRVTLRAPSEEQAIRRRLALEDALRTASLPGVPPNGLVLVRRLDLGPLAAGATSALIAQRIDQLIGGLHPVAVTAGREEHPEAAAVWFRDLLEPAVLIASLWSRGVEPRSWYWGRAFTGWRPGLDTREKKALVLSYLDALENSGLPAPALAEARGVLGRMELFREAVSADAGVTGRLEAAAARKTTAPDARRREDREYREYREYREDGYQEYREYRQGREGREDRQARERSGAVDGPSAAGFGGTSGGGDGEGAAAVELAPAALATPRIHPLPQGDSVKRHGPPPPSSEKAEGASVGGADPSAPAVREGVRQKTGAPPLRFLAAESDTAPSLSPSVDAAPWGGSGESRPGPDGPFFTPVPCPDPFRLEGAHSAWAGLPFLLVLLLRLGAADPESKRPAAGAPWLLPLLLRAAALRLNIDEEDPVLAFVPSAPEPAELPPDADRIVAAWLVAAARFLRCHARLTLAALVHRPGLVALSRTHLDVSFRLEQADLRLRRIGLDLDPGWVPGLGRVVAFHYRERGELP